MVNNEAEWLDYKDCDFEPGETQTLKFSFKPKKAGMLEFNLTDALADPAAQSLNHCGRKRPHRQL